MLVQGEARFGPHPSPALLPEVSTLPGPMAPGNALEKAEATGPGIHDVLATLRHQALCSPSPLTQPRPFGDPAGAWRPAPGSEAGCLWSACPRPCRPLRLAVTWRLSHVRGPRRCTPWSLFSVGDKVEGIWGARTASEEVLSGIWPSPDVGVVLTAPLLN